MEGTMLRADCARCAGLCCVALAFDRSALFGFDKPAGEACRHLDGAYRCEVHARLEAEGMAGCARYDCLGAGQRVTLMFAGSSWRDGPAQARAMFRAFRIMREVHRLLLLLQAAAALPLSPAQRRRLTALAAELAVAGAGHAALLRFERGSTARDVGAFLAGLRESAGALRGS